jgi:hypothetical protein
MGKLENVMGILVSENQVPVDMGTIRNLEDMGQR